MDMDSVPQDQESYEEIFDTSDIVLIDNDDDDNIVCNDDGLDNFIERMSMDEADQDEDHYEEGYLSPLSNELQEVENPNAEENKYKHLLTKMLELETPIITKKMISILEKDQICQMFLNFIVRVPESDDFEYGPLPFGSISSDRYATRETSVVTPELKMSYAATRLLAGNNEHTLMSCISSSQIHLATRCIFKIFQPNASGNFHHGCQVLDILLKSHLDTVYETIGMSSEAIGRYLGNMIECIEYEPVSSTFLNIICKPLSSESIRWYQSSPAIKWKFFQSLSSWRLLIVLSKHVNSWKHSAEHRTIAAEILLELLNRLSIDENGEILLQPIVHCPEFLSNLISAALHACNNIKESAHQAPTMKFILTILENSSIQKLPLPTFNIATVGGMDTFVPNRLAPLRVEINTAVANFLSKFSDHLLQQYEAQHKLQVGKQSSDGNDASYSFPIGSVRHTSYVVNVPFTEFRMYLVRTIVALVSFRPHLLTLFTPQLWKVLVNWFFDYPHTNVYHSCFYQLVFYALRLNDKSTLEILIKQLKFVSTLVDHYQHKSNRTSNRGFILSLCNAIRLQALTLPPDSFLRSFLQNHASWRNFAPELRQQTLLTRGHGLGLTVPKMNRFMTITGIIDISIHEEADWDGIDHGSQYAKSLGFVDDIAWPTEEIPSKKKKNKKSKGKKSVENSKCSQVHEADENVSITKISTDTENSIQDQAVLPTNGSNNPKKKLKRRKKSKGKSKTKDDTNEDTILEDGEELSGNQDDCK